MKYARIALFAALALGPSFAQRVYAVDDPLGLYVACSTFMQRPA
jgi:hypothetical protein